MTGFIMAQNTRKTEPGTPIIKQNISIVIDPEGPYWVYGKPPLIRQTITLNEENIPWDFQDGESYSTDEDPTALCRCGHSGLQPYCDGSHLACNWDPTLTADNVPLLENAESYDGPTIKMTDNIKYCAYARFCDIEGQVWNLIEKADTDATRETVLHGALHCPAGRLKIWDKQQHAFIEPEFEPSIGLIEDPQKCCSGPLWVKGGIPIDSGDGRQYELRNRVTLCRCGASSNKPFCDGEHIETKFQDGLDEKAKGLEGN